MQPCWVSCGALHKWLWHQVSQVQRGRPLAGDLQWAGGGLYQQSVWMSRQNFEETARTTSLSLPCKHCHLHPHMEQMATILQEVQPTPVFQSWSTGLWTGAQRSENGGKTDKLTQESEGAVEKFPHQKTSRGSNTKLHKLQHKRERRQISSWQTVYDWHRWQCCCWCCYEAVYEATAGTRESMEEGPFRENGWRKYFLNTNRGNKIAERRYSQSLQDMCHHRLQHWQNVWSFKVEGVLSNNWLQMGLWCQIPPLQEPRSLISL